MRTPMKLLHIGPSCLTSRAIPAHAGGPQPQPDVPMKKLRQSLAVSNQADKASMLTPCSHKEHVVQGLELLTRPTTPAILVC